MSIITDALKKAQARRLKNKNAKAQQDTPSSEENPEQYLDSMIQNEKMKRTGAFKSSRAISLFLAIFVVLLLVGVGFFMMSSRPTAPRQVLERKEPARALEETKKTKPAAVSAPVATKPRYERPKRSEWSEEETFTTKETSPSREKPGSFPSLSGIMYSPTNPQAIIDGDMLSEGETVRGFKIKKILPNKVKLTYDGKEYELRLR